jgi:hypothetical protein
VNRRFARQLENGNRGEQLVAAWLRSRGFGVIDSYEFSGKGGDQVPRLQFSGEGFALPDLDVCRGGARRWLEVKTLYEPVINRQLNALVHGICGHSYEHYVRVEQESGAAVFLAVLEVKSGQLLVARLVDLILYPCRCTTCRAGLGVCVSTGFRRGLYFQRTQLGHWHTFSDDDMRTMRARWCVSSRAAKAR